MTPVPAALQSGDAPTPANHSGISMTAVSHTLPNGLQVLIHPDSAHPLVSAQIWIKAGSLHEEAWSGAGLAHCLEHMLFKGTPTRNPQRISQEIQELGGYVNAYTSFNRTVYWIDGLAENLRGYLDVLGDMVRNSLIDADELTREKDVIRREMAMDHDDPDSTLQHLMLDTAFRRHPLKHPIIGHREIFDQIGRDEVAGFMARHYVPENTFVVITGDVEEASAMETVKEVLGDWPRRAYEPVLLPPEPPLRGRRSITKSFATEQTHLACGWVIPGESHPDKPALDVLAFLLGSGRSSRLYQTLHEDQGIAHDVWAGAWCAPETGLFQIEADCQPKDADACRAGLINEIRRMQSEPPALADLAKAVRATTAGQIRSLATTRGQAAILGHSWLTIGSFDYPSQYLGSIAALRPEDIQRVACDYLKIETACLAELGPDAESKPGISAASAQRADSLPKRFHLSNGLTVILQSNPRLPLVSVRAEFLAGILAESDETAGLTMVTAEMIVKGTKHRTALQIASELENLGGHLRCSADAHRLVLGADVMKEDALQALDLLSDLAGHATLPSEALPDVIKHQVAAIQEEREDPLTVALRRARREIFADLPFARTALGTESSVPSLKVTHCRELIDQTLCGKNGVISVFGDIDEASILSALEDGFGKLPSGERPIDARRVWNGSSPSGEWEDRLDKKQAVIVIGFRANGLLHTDTPVLSIIDEACSDMGSRLFNRIREELGLAYYVGAQSFAAMGAGAFYFYVGTDPQKAHDAEKEMLSLIGDLAKNGLSDEELSRAKTTWRSSWLRSQQGSAAMADACAWNELNGHGFDRFQRLPDIVNAITSADVRRVAAAYLDPATAFITRVMPA